MIDKVNNGIIVLNDEEKNIQEVQNQLDRKGENVSKTIENFRIILENDKNLEKHIRYNIFSYRVEYFDFNDDGSLKEVRIWTDADESYYMKYIEELYGLYDEKKYRHAFRIVSRERTYHPLKDLIEDGEWDGKPRIDNFLKDILKCYGNADYLREVSRMIFYGGISRVYMPGIKFDYMIVLSGKQGIGKSTIVSWLALNHSFYKEVTTVKDREGVECILGGWICEFSELMAFHGKSTSEAIKAFITRQVDRCRLSYDKYTSEFPRGCIFIGTTNETNYLNDETGNRRYLPLTMGLEVGELYENEKYVKDYISQCWKEALHLFKEKKTYLTIPKEYADIVLENQSIAKVEDIKLQDIENYLDTKEIGYKLCSKELLINVFRKKEVDINSYDPRLISKYMASQNNWVRKNAMELPEYGNQRYWVKVEKSEREILKEKENEIETDEEDDL